METRSPYLVNVSPKAEQLSETIVGQGAFKCNQLFLDPFEWKLTVDFITEKNL